jgi:iron complex outermembrane receptor protein
VDLRGFGETGGTHTLVTVDGRRLNQIDLSGVDFTTIPVENIERIEILHGPAGVLYGDSAVGGVINIVTKEGTGKPGGKLETQYGSYGLWGLNGNFQGATDKASWFVSARQASSDGYRQNSETRLRNATFNTRYFADPTLSFLVDGVFNQANYSLPGALSEQQMNRDRRQSVSDNQWADNRDYSLRGQARKDFGAAGALTADLSYRERKAKSELWSKQDTNIGTWGLQPKHVLDSNVFGLANRLTLGVDYFKWDMNTDTYQIGGPKTGSVDYKLDSLGLYLLEELNLTPKLVLTFGGRLQKADYDIDNKPVGGSADSRSFGNDQYAWTTGLAYSFSPQSKVFGRVSRAFRYPTVEEYVTYGTFCDLSPEKIMNYEVGTEYTFLKTGRASLTAYWMQLKDEITYNPATYLNENLDDTEHKGLEAALRVPLWAGAHAFGSLTLEEAKFTSGIYDGKHLPLVPDWSGSAGISVTIIKNLTAMARLNYVGERYFGNDKENAYDKMDSYVTTDVHLNYKWRALNFFLNADNILDEKYCSYGYAGSWGKSYYPEPGLVVWGGVGMSF